MSQVQSEATELQSQYAAQLTADLERNTKEQERIAAEVASLEELLAALRRDQSLLVNLRRTLGDEAPATAGAARDAKAAPTVPRQASAGAGPAGQQKAAAAKPRKTAAKSTPKATDTKAATGTKAGTDTGAKAAADTKTVTKTATKPAAKTTAKPTAKPTTKAAPKADARTAAKPAADAGTKTSVATDTKASVATGTKASAAAVKPTLVELIHDHLSGQSEPRSAAEITSTLSGSHPERGIKATVVRTTVEGLVAKGRAQRSKQGTSVYYTAAEAGTAGEPAEQPAPRQETPKQETPVTA